MQKIPSLDLLEGFAKRERMFGIDFNRSTGAFSQESAYIELEKPSRSGLAPPQVSLAAALGGQGVQGIWMNLSR